MEGNGKKNCCRRDGEEAAVMVRGFGLILILLVLSCSVSFAGGCGCSEEEQFRGETPVPMPGTFSIHGKTNSTRTVHQTVKPMQAEKVASVPAEVHPEKTVYVELSNTDLNRVVCTGGEISDVLFSREKGIRVKTTGNDAFIKFMLQTGEKPGDRPETVSVPAEFYLVCAGETYSFIGKPEPVPSRTIYLVSQKANLQAGQENFQSSPFDQAVTRIIRTIFLGSIPSSWNIEQRPFRRLVIPTRRGTLDLQETQAWRIPGAGVTARLFHVQGVEKGEMQVLERDLLYPEITTNPIAVSIEDNLLSPAMPATRAVILERVVDTGV